MCFSAEASFAGGVVISAIGIATLTKVHKSSQVLFAGIPLFFGMQQIAEGVLWLTLPCLEYSGIQKLSMYIFLVMAQVIWPFLTPLSVLLMEENEKRKFYLKILLVTGILLSAYYGFCFANFEVTPRIINYHIQYDHSFPQIMVIPTSVAYLLVTIGPLFISSIKRTHVLGILVAASCLVTAIFFTQYLTSVWCFFAAIISGIIFWILNDSKRKFRIEKLNLMKHHFKTKS